MTEENNNLITLVDEEGEEHRFNLLNVVELDGAKYAVMVPEGNVANENDEEEAVIFRIETDDEGEEVLVDIEDDEEFARVCDYLDELMYDYEDDDDEDEKDPQ